MAEMKFTCPGCGQPISCDVLWGGHIIECPTCKREITVPQQQSAPVHAARTAGPAPAASGSLVPEPPPETRLSIGQSKHEAAAGPAASAKAPQAQTGGPLGRPMGRGKKKSPAMKYVKIGVALVVVGVGGYFALGVVHQ